MRDATSPMTPGCHSGLNNTIAAGCSTKDASTSSAAASTASASSLRRSSLSRSSCCAKRAASAREWALSNATAVFGSPTRPAALMRVANANPTLSDVALPTRAVRLSSAIPTLESRPPALISASPLATMMRFSPMSGTRSATVPIAASGSSLFTSARPSSADSPLRASWCANLNATPAPHK